MAIEKNRRRPSSVYKLHVHRVMRRIPMSYLGRQYVQHVAVMAEDLYELMRAVRSREFDAALPRIPAPDVWLGFYRNHEAITRGVADGLPDLWGMDGDHTQQLLDDSRAISLEENANPGSLSKELLREYGPSYLARVFRLGIKQAELDYKRHLRELRSELRGVACDDGIAAFDAALTDQPAVYFYVRVVLPAILLMRTTPQRLLRQARSAVSPAKRLEAVEHLVRLDPLAIQMPEVQDWINADSGDVRLERESMVLRWRQQGLDHKQFQRQGFKAVMGSLIQSIAERMGAYLDGKGQWHESGMTAQQVRELLNAVALDRAGVSRGVADEDIEALTLNSWKRQLSRYKKHWDKLVPSIRGQKSG